METKDLMYKRAYVWDKLNAEERKAERKAARNGVTFESVSH